MRREFAIVVFAFLIWSLQPLLEGQVGRKVFYNPGVAISTLIQPGDRRVQVVWDAPPLMGFFPGDIPGPI